MEGREGGIERGKGRGRRGRKIRRVLFYWKNKIKIKNWNVCMLFPLKKRKDRKMCYIIRIRVVYLEHKIQGQEGVLYS
jgi:hypothetical protein